MLGSRRDIVGGEIFNLCEENYQVKDVAKEIYDVATKYVNPDLDILFEKDDMKGRSYRVSGNKIKKILGFSPRYSLNASLIKLIKEVMKDKDIDFDNPIYYNIRWLKPVFEKEVHESRSNRI